MGQKSRDNARSYESCSSQKTSLRDSSRLRGTCTPGGGSQGRWDVGEKNQIIGLKEDKDPEELTCISDLATFLLPSSSIGVHPHPFPLGVHLCLDSISFKLFLLCSSICCCTLSLIINFVPAFRVSAFLINAFFTGGKDPGKNIFQPLALAGLVARIPGSHPA